MKTGSAFFIFGLFSGKGGKNQPETGMKGGGGSAVQGRGGGHGQAL